MPYQKSGIESKHKCEGLGGSARARDSLALARGKVKKGATV